MKRPPPFGYRLRFRQRSYARKSGLFLFQSAHFFIAGEISGLGSGLAFSLLAVPLPAQVDRPPAFSKVVVIIFENTEFDEIIGNPDAPFFNQLASQYGLATNYFGITHPSLPNYLATIGGDTFGVRDNCEDLRRCNRREPFPSNLADQVEASGRT